MSIRPANLGAALLLGVAFVAPSEVRPTPLTVDTSSRSAVVDLFESIYQTPTGSSGWNGNVASCLAGDVTASYREQALRRVSYFRAMAGLPAELSLRSDWNAKCQMGALMLNANRQLSHNPPPSWLCYTTEGAEALSKSNIAYGYPTAPDAVTQWMLDDGITTAGHRRWVLHPPLQTVGFGCTFGGTYRSYAMWVIGGAGTRPIAPEWVSWPPPGFVPWQVVNGLWSFSYPGASFGSASVTMSREGSPVGVTLHPVANGYADNTLVWTAQGFVMAQPARDVTYRVTVSNVLVGGSPRSFTWESTIIDPASVTTSASIDPPGATARIARAVPNPFSGRTTVHYELDVESDVTLAVYDVAGRLVDELLRGRQTAGAYTIAWDGKDRGGTRLSPGIYLCRLQAGAESLARVLVLAK